MAKPKKSFGKKGLTGLAAKADAWSYPFQNEEINHLPWHWDKYAGVEIAEMYEKETKELNAGALIERRRRLGTVAAREVEKKAEAWQDAQNILRRQAYEAKLAQERERFEAREAGEVDVPIKPDLPKMGPTQIAALNSPAFAEYAELFESYL